MVSALVSTIWRRCIEYKYNRIFTNNKENKEQFLSLGMSDSKSPGNFGAALADVYTADKRSNGP